MSLSDLRVLCRCRRRAWAGRAPSTRSVSRSASGTGFSLGGFRFPRPSKITFRTVLSLFSTTSTVVRNFRSSLNWRVFASPEGFSWIPAEPRTGTRQQTQATTTMGRKERNHKIRCPKEYITTLRSALIGMIFSASADCTECSAQSSPVLETCIPQTRSRLDLPW